MLQHKQCTTTCIKCKKQKIQSEDLPLELRISWLGLLPLSVAAVAAVAGAAVLPCREESMLSATAATWVRVDEKKLLQVRLAGAPATVLSSALPVPVVLLCALWSPGMVVLVRANTLIRVAGESAVTDFVAGWAAVRCSCQATILR